MGHLGAGPQLWVQLPLELVDRGVLGPGRGRAQGGQLHVRGVDEEGGAGVGGGPGGGRVPGHRQPGPQVSRGAQGGVRDGGGGGGGVEPGHGSYSGARLGAGHTAGQLHAPAALGRGRAADTAGGEGGAEAGAAGRAGGGVAAAGAARPLALGVAGAGGQAPVLVTRGHTCNDTRDRIDRTFISFNKYQNFNVSKYDLLLSLRPWPHNHIFCKNISHMIHQ